MLDIWPQLPIVVGSDGYEKWGVDNILAALEHRDRICGIYLSPLTGKFSSSQMGKFLAAMQRPFPALRSLDLKAEYETPPIDSDSFLGGSAPCLQELRMERVQIPGLPKLLLSATHLVRLQLWNISHSGYISPEAMFTCLSVLPRLEILSIIFKSFPSDQESRRPPPQTRTLIPALVLLSFLGVSGYLEDLVARIDAPLLRYLTMSFFHQQTFDTPQLNQFISRTPNIKARDEAGLNFTRWDVHVRFPLAQTFGFLQLGISCSQRDWRLSSLAQLCSSSFPQGFPVVERLFVQGKFTRPHWQDDIEVTQWLELLHPFTAVKDLFVSKDFAPCVVLVLQELLGERVTEVLPALQALFLEEPLPSGPVLEIIGKFVAARQLAGHPISVSRWLKKVYN